MATAAAHHLRAERDVEQAADEEGKHQPQAGGHEQRDHRGDELAPVRQQVGEEARGLGEGFAVDGDFGRGVGVGNGGGDGVGHGGGNSRKETRKSKTGAALSGMPQTRLGESCSWLARPIGVS